MGNVIDKKVKNVWKWGLELQAKLNRYINKRSKQNTLKTFNHRNIIHRNKIISDRKDCVEEVSIASPFFKWGDMVVNLHVSTKDFKVCLFCRKEINVFKDKRGFFYIRCTSKACFNEVITQWDNSWWGSKETYRSIDDLREAWNRRVS